MDNLQQITIDDPRVYPAWRESADIKKLLASGVKLFWDSMDCKVRLIRPSDGRLHRVVVKNALQRERRVR